MPPRTKQSGCYLIAVVLIARVTSAQPSVVTPPPNPPASTPAAPPTTRTGSLAPDVVFEDITYTLRRTIITAITVNHHDPNIAYVGSFDGYLFRTTDGGKTWDEWRLVHETKPFYGDSGERVYFGIHRKDAAAWSSRHLNGKFRTEAISGPSKLYKIRPSPVSIGTISPVIAVRGSASANVNFGVGLPGGAPRLQTVVRKFTYSRPANLGMAIGASGLNIKQTLLFRGLRWTEVRRIVIHPTDPKIAFTATLFGLFMTYDGGINWVRTFQGVNPRETATFHVAVNPNNPRHVLLATGNGMFVSDDGGNNFMKSTAQGLGEGTIDWIYYNPRDPRYVFACTNYGLLRSADGGKNWEWVFFTTFPTARIVRMVVLDPFSNRGYIATHDGIFTTANLLTATLEDWTRLGGLRFTGSESWKIEVCPKHKGHMWVHTAMRLPSADPYRAGNHPAGGSFIWETIDGGRTWKVIYSGDTSGAVSWFDRDPVDPDLLWIAWSRSLTRMRRIDPNNAIHRSASKRRQAEETLQTFPSFPEVMAAAQRFTGIHCSRRLTYRQLARLRVLVPRLDASYTYYRYRGYPLLHDGLYMLPFRRSEDMAYKYHEFRVMLRWDLSDLVFNLEASLFGRIARLNGELEGYMLYSIQRYYGELRRLRLLMVTNPPSDLRVRLMYKLRIKELESYIDLFTGGYLTRYRRGDKPRGFDTPWFDLWPGIGSKWIRGADH